MVIVAGLAPLALSACGGVLCPASVPPYPGQLMNIQSAVDATSGTAIREVLITNLTINGEQGNLSDTSGLFTGRAQNAARNVMLDGETLKCTVACAFGWPEGTYRFTISAPGYQPQDVEATTSYQSYPQTQWRCSSLKAQPAVLNFKLTPSRQ
ncbi:hypothetical protein [Deinococcus peraridilitoris]|uniref:Carboxypeptidase regulatory-like domain-containing protein n=1 Tax=Deinococcus peraridilitoris (strain DSM 19664 / LMG 22246 / CIP 109416 / KR-200) TaxID=937777 RepID=L0A8E3_DEIPD|nr:hypothetical protein [Deinococcus peraridilitoris]AFZ69694.1 hypothetical protein Deipe_4354 [Deinococcus peraridilitoris DSM 19664]